MRAVVTGGAGFIGSHLVDAVLDRGWSVVVVDDFSSGLEENVTRYADEPRFEFIEADICGDWTVEGPVDLVLNFASPASPPKFLERPLETLEVGSTGMKKVAEMAMAKGARLIQASTSEVYGEPQVHPQPEEYWGNVNPIGPRSVYDESKRYAEAMLGAYHRMGLLDVGVVRIFNTYGPRLHATDGRVVSNFVHQALSGKPLSVYGTGKQTRSFCYVGDLVRGILALADLKGELGPVNLGNPQEITVLELAQIVGELTGVSVSLEYSDLPTDDPTQRKPDITRAQSLLGWEPEVDLREGLVKTIEWYSAHALVR
ncbi:UDP-glucuronic acid decarboxylase family protein [Lentzea sp. BCCO 10_0856]|uniref:UDP-glucuronic acid decarboxylase family protein n=1 Tax=Lentzea miocenica TaxID=3095431 RepID=A0ABU4T1Y1_9PSEU|nr:UDP-glucuronic acid decarboxylase family protein [Lentzea sp. BCCO 10_0856]MDX8032158.1 UDP-glucuronic acid decarboxylase family protein [Lentzea sp. BCCO 10_0856]